MALILLIETSASVCSTGLSLDGKIIAIREETVPNRHAELLSVFCAELLAETGYTPASLNAVAVSGGPGSYTGLRIGTSTAKGYCFALNIPLISISTLEAMAIGMRSEANENELLCPMIDARRMEVYSTIFSTSLETISPVAPVVVDETSYADILRSNIVWFSGDGMEKLREVLSTHPNSRFTPSGKHSVSNMAAAAEARFALGQFENLAYYVPYYLKNFQPGPKRSAI